MELTHLDHNGRPKMVDVSEKPVTRRRAAAAGYLELCAECANALESEAGAKGDPWSLARISAIAGVKHTSLLLPLAHPLTVDAIDMDHCWEAVNRRAWLRVGVSCESRTGVEMEAIVGAAAGLAGLYDALKAISHDMSLGPVRLLRKVGGRRGTISAAWPECPWVGQE